MPATSTDVPVTSATQLTSHAGNDYVPEPISNGTFIVVSDLGTNVICGDPNQLQPGPTADLDLALIDPVGGTRLNLTDNDAADEMLLIGDEVSWFCGLKPNLSACTYQPRIMRAESLWLEKTAWLKLAGFVTASPLPPIEVIMIREVPSKAWSSLIISPSASPSSSGICISRMATW